MFDKNTLAQLNELKDNIVSSKDYAEGLVVGTNGRFGFVKTDDGRTAFLNPDKMQHVLPGDRVKALLTINKKDKLEAELEELLETGTKKFIGNYRIKGNNHFVQVDAQIGGRWLFIPPQFRKNCNEDDLVLAELNRHPFNDGKASAKILNHIGAATDDFIHHNRVIAQYELNQEWSKDELQQAKIIADKIELADREDLSCMPFVTIDSPSTRDMDDAIYATTDDAGNHQLWVAIADPSNFIQPGSPVARRARACGQSVYLPARTLPMLPETLATETFSLIADVLKPALVCCMEVDKKGTIVSFEFKHAKIKSHKKLSYREVTAFLDDDTQTQSQTITDSSDEIKASLKLADKITQARLSYRQEHNLVHGNLTDYDLRINPAGLIEGIQQRERGSSHRLVEEAMLSTNICAGDYLAEHNTGVFSAHVGFRMDRIGEVRSLLREDLDADANYDNINEYNEHLALIGKLKDDKAYLLPPLKRMMQNTEISTKIEPHLSLGVKHYATITSPIRRYIDLCNHWSIIQILGNQKAQKMPDNVLEQLQESLTNNRLASRQLELTLIGHYLLGNGDADKALLGDNALTGNSTIRIITQKGFGVRLNDTGVEGFIQIPKKADKTYDAKRMTLTVNGTRYALDDTVKVKVMGVDLEKRRVKMELVDEFSKPEPTTPKPTTEESAD